jgi:hypothetical protein
MTGNTSPAAAPAVPAGNNVDFTTNIVRGGVNPLDHESRFDRGKALTWSSFAGEAVPAKQSARA